jgi:hypothetical protein
MAFNRRAFLSLFGAAPVVLKAWEHNPPEPSAHSGHSVPAAPRETVSYYDHAEGAFVTAGYFVSSGEFPEVTFSYAPTVR